MTPLEERFKETIYLGGLSSRKDQDAVSCALLSEEIAIGFSKWLHYDVKASQQDYGANSPYYGKTDRELFSMYMESLKH